MIYRLLTPPRNMSPKVVSIARFQHLRNTRELSDCKLHGERKLCVQRWKQFLVRTRNGLRSTAVERLGTLGNSRENKIADKPSIRLSVDEASPVTVSCPLTIDIAAVIDRQRCNALEILGIGRRVGHAPFLVLLQMLPVQENRRWINERFHTFNVVVWTFVEDYLLEGQKERESLVTPIRPASVVSRGWKCFL